MKKIIILSISIFTLFSCRNDESSNEISNSSLNLYSKVPAQDPGNVLQGYDFFPVQLFRFYNGNEHFYTIYNSEGNNNGYALEGNIGYAAYPAYNSWPIGSPFSTLTRWRNQKNGDRLITIDVNELNGNYQTFTSHFAVDGLPYSNSSTSGFVYNGNPSGDWIFEGFMGYTHYQTTITNTVHRYYNPSKKQHFWTTDWNELGNGSNGFNYEGVAFYTSKTPSGVY